MLCKLGVEAIAMNSLMARIQAARLNALKEPQAAFETGQQLLWEAREKALQQEEAAALFVMALACRSMSKLDHCYQYAEESLKCFEALEDAIGMATALNLIGVVYFYYGKLDTALQYFLRAKYSLESESDPTTLSRILNNLGEVYRETGDLDAAFEAYNAALAICTALEIKPNIAVILENIGEIYYRQQAFDLSYTYFTKSFEMLSELQDTVALSEVESKIGKMLFLKGKTVEAKSRCYKALERLQNLNNKYFAIGVLEIIAEIKKHTGSPDYLDDLLLAIDYAETLGARKQLHKLYRLLYEHHEAAGDFEMALSYFKKFHYIALEIESTVVSHKLEIIKIELNKAFEGDTVEKVKALNSQLEIEIANQSVLLTQLEKANSQLDSEANLDELTQVLSRRGLRERLAQVWSRKDSKVNSIALLMIDIDFFKQFNDVYGHMQGDRCLYQIAAIMKTSLINEPHLLARFGGEEFVCLLWDCPQIRAFEIAEKLRLSIANTGIELAEATSVAKVTVSIGAVIKKNVRLDDLQDLYTLADVELYKAKDQGRNRTCMQTIDGNYR